MALEGDVRTPSSPLLPPAVLSGAMCIYYGGGVPEQKTIFPPPPSLSLPVKAWCEGERERMCRCRSTSVGDRWHW